MTEDSLFLTWDAALKNVVGMAKNIASTKANILILGESGTGKEVLARYIHSVGHRKQNRFVAINCAAVPENLLESELFGHERGSFTGAVAAKPGKFEVASGGTLLLDEMGEMPLHLQAKILRVIQEGEIERIGATRPLKVNVRLVATTHRNLKQMVEQGTFREDLYYRLKVIELIIPPLRDRPQDILNFAEHFLKKVVSENGLETKQLSESCRQALLKWDWPGNVRELENTIERAALLSPANILEADALSLDLSQVTRPSQVSVGMTISEAEKLLIMKTLEFTKSNRTEAARLLGISVRTLRNKLHEYKETSL